MTEDIFLQPNLSINETVNLVKEKIKSETPFALTRFGDGEIAILKRSCGDHFLHKNCGLWGYPYPEGVEDFFKDSINIIQTALVKTDVIGIMDKNTKVLPEGFYIKHVWSLEKSFVESLGVDLEKQKICDHMLSRHKEFGSVDGVRDILQGKSVHIITPHKTKLENKNLSNLLQTEVRITEHPFSVNFNNRDEFLKSMETIKEPVVLLGIGLQKDYGVFLKEVHGKIALDMGATLDAWAGLETRQWFQQGGIQSYLTI
jgi:hypothetical protein